MPSNPDATPAQKLWGRPARPGTSSVRCRTDVAIPAASVIAHEAYIRMRAANTDAENLE